AVESLLAGGRATTRALAGTRVGVRALATDRETTAVAEAAVAAEIHEALDVQRHLAAEVTLDLEVLVDGLADLADLGVVQVVRLLALGDARELADALRAVRTDAVDVLQRDDRVLPAG